MVTDDRSVVYLPTPREGPSPFLEGTCIQFAFDSTCLGAFKKCPRFYQLSIIEGWKPKADRVHLSFGIHYTNALEFYDKLKAGYMVCDEERTIPPMDHEEALLEVVNKMMLDTWVDEQVDGQTDQVNPGYRWEHGAHDSGIGNKNFSNLLRSVIWYLDEFRNDPAETVIAEDGTPLIERSFRLQLDYGPTAAQGETHQMAMGDLIMTDPRNYILCGHLDRVVTFTGGTYVMDHKTTKTTISDYYFDQYEPNNQMSLYTLAGQVIFGSPVRGVMIDACQVAVGFSRFARGLTYRTPAQLEEWLFDLKHWLAQAEAYATAGYWPMNDVACYSCDFNRHDGKICAKDPRVRKDFLKASFTKEDPWNPLKTRN